MAMPDHYVFYCGGENLDCSSRRAQVSLCPVSEFGRLRAPGYKTGSASCDSRCSPAANAARIPIVPCSPLPSSLCSLLPSPSPHLWDARHHFAHGMVSQMQIILPFLRSSRRTPASKSHWPSAQVSSPILAPLRGLGYLRNPLSGVILLTRHV